MSDAWRNGRIGRLLLILLLTPFSMTMLVDGAGLDSSQVLQHGLTDSDGWECRYWTTVLNGWEKGETIELEVDYRITDDIFDGEGVYNEGRYHQIIYVDVE